jgi:mRNA-degrading endonuclease toxin of MazEF toxin-antitoxin module
MGQNAPGHPSPSPKRGDVYWVQIPKEHIEGSEHRDTDEGNPHPYVILSRDSANDRLNGVIGVPLSTRLHKANKTFRPLIKASELLPDAGNEMQDSVALCDHIREISLKRFVRKLGRPQYPPWQELTTPSRSC